MNQIKNQLKKRGNVQINIQMKNQIKCLKNQQKKKAQTKIKVQQIGMIRTNLKKY